MKNDGALGNLAVLSLLTATGCPAVGTAAAGVVTGQVLYLGKPAPGKVISLLVSSSGSFSAYTGAGGQAATASTDASGIYKFSGVPAGTYEAEYLSEPVSDGSGIPMSSGEVAWWKTLPGTVSGSGGAAFPAFDVAYNGLIYPQTGKTYYVTAAAPLPFHWSTDPQGQSYQLLVFSDATGQEQDASGKNQVIFRSPWSGDPSSIFKQDLTPDLYSWAVAIDGGNTGQGRTPWQVVDMSPPTAPSPGG